MITRISTQLVLVAVLGLTGTAHAALQGRDFDGNLATFEAYYDSHLNITLMSIDVGSLGVTWATANTLAANHSITVGTNVFSNWRLPTAQLDASCLDLGSANYFGCTGSELGHLSVTENLNSGFVWSGTEDAGKVWAFNMNSDVQFLYPKSDSAFLLAVHAGDVAAVPEADTWAMLLVGLGLVGGAVRLKAVRA